MSNTTWLTCLNCKTRSPLVMFLYQLMINGTNPQTMIKIIDSVHRSLDEDTKEKSLDIGGLAMLAQDMARMLTGEGAISNHSQVTPVEDSDHSQITPVGLPA